MSGRPNHNSHAVVAAVPAAKSYPVAGEPPAATETTIHHIYVHIPFCARICPYCAFYKDLLDRSQTWRFCEAVVNELRHHQSARRTEECRSFLRPSTIYFGGGTPTALNIAQLELLLR